MLTFHRWRHTWQEQVDGYIALTDFARQKFIQGGLPAEKIAVKPNFLPARCSRGGSRRKRGWTCWPPPGKAWMSR